MPADRRSKSGSKSGVRRGVVVGAAGVAAGLALVAAVVWLAGPSGQVELRLGDRDFRDLDAVRISAEIAKRGPVLFSDVAGGSRDIILQHLGADPESGWLAFEARRAGQDRRCFFQWRAGGDDDSGGDATGDGEGGGAGGGGDMGGSEDGAAVGGGEDGGGGHFVNSCEPDDVVDARGTGLVQFPVAVIDGDIRVDINAAGGG